MDYRDPVSHGEGGMRFIWFVKRWLEEIGERPAVKKAMAMGPEFREDPASISADEQARRRKLVADQRAQPIPSEWIRAA